MGYISLVRRESPLFHLLVTKESKVLTTSDKTMPKRKLTRETNILFTPQPPDVDSSVS